MTGHQVAARWKVRAPEREGLIELSRACRVSSPQAKVGVSETGLALAWAEIDEIRSPSVRVITPREVLRRAIRHAIAVVSDHRPPRETYLEDAPGGAEAAIERSAYSGPPKASDADEARVIALRALELSPGQRAVVAAIMDHGCTTLADVDWLMGWAPGSAAMHAVRIRAKAARSGKVL